MNGGTLGGNGTVGTLVANGAVLAPGNSIGTLNVNGGFTHNGGVYAVEVNAAGQNDRINVTGAATLNGAAVQVVAAAGTPFRIGQLELRIGTDAPTHVPLVAGAAVPRGGTFDRLRDGLAGIL